MAAILSSRRRNIPVKKVDQNLNSSFFGEIENKFDLAYHVSTKILFVSAQLKGEYHSLKNAIQKVKNSVKIHVED